MGGRVLDGGPLLAGAALDADGQLGQAADQVAAHLGLRGHLDLHRGGPALDLGGVVGRGHDAGPAIPCLRSCAARWPCPRGSWARAPGLARVAAIWASLAGMGKFSGRGRARWSCALRHYRPSPARLSTLPPSCVALSREGSPIGPIWLNAPECRGDGTDRRRPRTESIGRSRGHSPSDRDDKASRAGPPRVASMIPGRVAAGRVRCERQVTAVLAWIARGTPPPPFPRSPVGMHSFLTLRVGRTDAERGDQGRTTPREAGRPRGPDRCNVFGNRGRRGRVPSMSPSRLVAPTRQGVHLRLATHLPTDPTASGSSGSITT